MFRIVSYVPSVLIAASWALMIGRSPRSDSLGRRKVDDHDVNGSLREQEKHVLNCRTKQQVVVVVHVLQVIFDPELARGDRLGPDYQCRGVEFRNGANGGGTIRGVVVRSLQNPLVRKVVRVREVHRPVTFGANVPVQCDGAHGNVHAPDTHRGQQRREVPEVVPLVAVVRDRIAAPRVAPAALDDRLDQVDVEPLEFVTRYIPGLERRKRSVRPEEKLRDLRRRGGEDEPAHSNTGDEQDDSHDRDDGDRYTFRPSHRLRGRRTSSLSHVRCNRMSLFEPHRNDASNMVRTRRIMTRRARSRLSGGTPRGRRAPRRGLLS